jgi:DNA-binding transcriptional LysR family regulator
MERRDIEIFLTVADELHFSRAAGRLHVTPARVTQSIKLMERRIGAALFERTSRRVALTPIGQRLYDDLRPAHEQLVAGIERAMLAGREVRGALRVGFAGAAAGQFILAVTRQFAASYPDCDVQIRENQVNDAFRLLRDGEIDLLFTTLPIVEPDLATSEVILRENPLLAVCARHPFARRESVSLTDLARATVLRSPQALPEYWDRAIVTGGGAFRERGPAFNTIQEMLALIGADTGVYPVPEQARHYYARPDVTYLPIRDAPPWEWVLVRVTAAETGRTREFTRAARDLARTGAGTLNPPG